MSDVDDYRVYVGRYVSGLGAPIAVVTDLQHDEIAEQDYFAFFENKPDESIRTETFRIPLADARVATEPWKSWAKVTGYPAPPYIKWMVPTTTAKCYRRNRSRYSKTTRSKLWVPGHGARKSTCYWIF